MNTKGTTMIRKIVAVAFIVCKITALDVAKSQRAPPCCDHEGEEERRRRRASTGLKIPGNCCTFRRS